MKSLGGTAADTVYLTITKLFTTLSGILITKILSVGLSLEEYGTYSQALVIISVVSSLIFCGLGDCINYYYNGNAISDNEAKKKRVVNTIFLIEYILWLVSFLAIVLGQNLIVTFFSNPALASLAILIGLKPALENFLYFYQVLFVSIGKARLIATRNLIVSIGKVICIFCVMYFIHELWFILFVLIMLDVIQLLIFKLILGKHNFIINPFKSNLKFIPIILSYGLPMALYSITNMFSRDIDKLVVGNLSDESTLAIYTNCARILPFDIFAVSLSTILIPYIIRYIGNNQKKKAVSVFRTYLQAGYYTVWIFAAAVLLVTDLIIPFLYSEQYLSGKNIFIIYILDSMLRFSSMHLILTATGKTKKLMYYSLISVVLNFILNIILYFILGIIGPAIATFVSTLIYTMMVLNASAKELGVKWTDLFIKRDVMLVLLKIIIVGVPMYFAEKLLLNTGLQSYIVMFIIAGIFVLINFLWNFKNIKNILHRINRIKSN